MAKSLRSKSRRRNARLKREKHKPKEIALLLKTVGLTETAENAQNSNIVSDNHTLTEAVEEMEVCAASVKLKPRQHPAWKSQRKVKATANNVKKASKVKKKIKRNNKNKSKKKRK